MIDYENIAKKTYPINAPPGLTTLGIHVITSVIVRFIEFSFEYMRFEQQ